MMELHELAFVASHCVTLLMFLQLFWLFWRVYLPFYSVCFPLPPWWDKQTFGIQLNSWRHNWAKTCSQHSRRRYIFAVFKPFIAPVSNKPTSPNRIKCLWLKCWEVFHLPFDFIRSIALRTDLPVVIELAHLHLDFVQVKLEPCSLLLRFVVCEERLQWGLKHWHNTFLNLVDCVLSVGMVFGSWFLQLVNFLNTLAFNVVN